MWSGPTAGALIERAESSSCQMKPSQIPGVALPSSLEQALQPSNESRIITEPNEPFRIVHVNEAWCRVCGFDAEEALGQTCRILQGLGTCRATLAMLRQALLLKRNFAVQLLNYTKQGQPFMNTLQVTPLVNSDGHVTHYLGVVIARFLDGGAAVPPSVQRAAHPAPLPNRGLIDDKSDQGSTTSMLPADEGGAGGPAAAPGRVPPFLTKLSEILTKQPDSMVSLNHHSASFTIWDATKFAKEVLPQYFKHNKLGSFSQQLHTYGFRRKANASTLDSSVEFYHDQYNGDPDRFLEWIRGGGALSKRTHAREPVDEPPPPQLLQDMQTVAEGTRQLAVVFNQAKATHAMQLRSILMKLMLRGILAPESVNYISSMPPATPLLPGPGAVQRPGGYQQPAACLGGGEMPSLSGSLNLRWSTDGLQSQLDALEAGLMPLSSQMYHSSGHESGDLQGDEALQLFADSSMPMQGRPMPDGRQPPYPVNAHQLSSMSLPE